MLPFDRRPWARALATAVILASCVAAVWFAYYLYGRDSLHISEIVGIILLLLTIIPPNASIAMGKTTEGGSLNSTFKQPTLHHRTRIAH